jgi:23S rRNA pseudouridine1911/1915/1917 synthase
MPSTNTPTVLTFQVPEEYSGESYRLDRVLTELLEGAFSRQRIQALIKEGTVSVNGTVQPKVAFVLSEGDSLQLHLPAPVPLELAPEEIPLPIVFEDDHVLVVNKPAGMLTHPSGHELSGTLVNALLHHCRGKLSGINGVLRPGIVHRLDRDTSGLLMVAKTDIAHQSLTDQLRFRTAGRRYWAIAQGEFKETSGTIETFIGRDPKHRQKMRICKPEEGRSAITHWEAIESIHARYTLVRLTLETGRTHQIRVHLSSVGHPILGDAQYGNGLHLKLNLKTTGQLLQAYSLKFTHPVSQQAMAFEIPMEPEMESVLAMLRM